MFAFFAGFFIALYLLFAAAAVIGHVLVIIALMQPHTADEMRDVPPRPKTEAEQWRRAA
jgi:hypothetical protein